MKPVMPFKELEDWLRGRGGMISGVEAREMPSGDRGLFATRALFPGETIIQLPAATLITGDAARAAPHVAGVLQAVASERLEESLHELANCDPETVAIVLFIIGEAARGEGPWQPWIDSLPTVFYNPITAPQNIIEARLAGTYVLAFALEVREELRALYEEFIVPYAINRFPTKFPPEKVTFDLFLWAYSVSESRAFELGLNGKCEDNDSRHGSLLTPYADMMNHSCDPGVVSAIVRRWLYPDATEQNERGFEVCVGSKLVGKDEQIYISYGQLDNARLLLHYGFAEANNPNDHVKLTLAMPDDDCNDLLTKKLLLLEMAQCGSLGTEHELSVPDPLPWDLVASLRLLSMTTEEAELVTIRTDFTCPISVRNEQAVLDFLAGVLDALLPPETRHSRSEDGHSDGWSVFERFCEIYSTSLRSILISSSGKVQHLRHASLTPDVFSKD